MNSVMTEGYDKYLNNIASSKPLIQQITNYVTVNDCANITLAIGASPVMADAIEEVADIVKISSALVINIGTLNPTTLEAMFVAGKKANEINIPVILDPVGAGASTYRNEKTMQLLKEVNFSVIRGNISEMKFIAGLSANTKGVDASDEDATSDVGQIAPALAKEHNCVVVISGSRDIISDGKRTVAILNGHPAMANVTGTGCMSASLIASFCGANPDHIFGSAITAALCMGVAGEIAYERVGNLGTCSLRDAIIDEISKMKSATLVERGCVNEIS